MNNNVITAQERKKQEYRNTCVARSTLYRTFALSL